MRPLRTEVTPFVLADFARFEFIDEGGVALPLAEKMLNLNTLDTDRAFCGTVRRDGQVLFVGGFLESSPGVAEVFVIPEKTGIQKHPKVFHKLARRFLEHVLRKDWCDRAETASHTVPVWTGDHSARRTPKMFRRTFAIFQAFFRNGLSWR